MDILSRWFSCYPQGLVLSLGDALEELIGLEVEFVREDVPVGNPQARGKLIDIDQYGVVLQRHNGKRLAIPWNSFNQGGFIREK